jgi:hypothetical protein
VEGERNGSPIIPPDGGKVGAMAGGRVGNSIVYRMIARRRTRSCRAIGSGERDAR